MNQVTLTKIYTTDKDKQGNLLKSKTGNPYTRLSIQTKEYGDKWISGFQNKSNQNWKEGDKVEIVIKENGQYLNFETPNKEDVLMAMVQELNTRLRKVEDKVFPPKIGNTDIDYPENEFPDDIPFS